jgi:hypothetical protein
LLLYPKPFIARAMANDPMLTRKLWLALNEIQTKSFLAEGRVYGGGLYKMEPKELALLPAEHLLKLIPTHESLVPLHQASFLMD